MAALFLWLAYEADLNVRAIRQANEGIGVGYASRVDSPALRYVREASLTGVMFSNDAAAAYIHTDTLANHRYLPCEKDKLRLRAEDPALTGGGGAYVLWFHGQGSAECGQHGLASVADLRGLPWLELLAELSDGVIFRFNP